MPERFASAFPDVSSAANSLSAEEFAYYAKRNEESLDPEFEGAVDARCSEIKAAFERVRSY
ncbi:MAG: hypothetical protein ACR2PZ_14080 [Pseudomonadales bacterium]